MRVWIDLNNDGLFNSTELLYDAQNSASPHTGTITIPATVVMGTPLRMRVGCDRYTFSTPQPCTNVYYGEFEDYTVVVQSNSLPPNASSACNVLDECQGVVQFVDMSTNFPTAWYWDFGDGTTSTFQNPFHTFSNAGFYNVTLTATNVYGADTYSQSTTINSLNASIDILNPTALNQSIQFEANAVGAISWEWDFGDGYSAAIQSPMHVYTTQGQYIVTLTVTNGTGCSAVAIDTIYVSPVGIEELSGGFTIYPNPNSGELFITNMHNANIKKITILSAIGGKVYQFENKNGFFETEHIILNDVSTGIYFVKVEFEDDEIVVKKFVIQDE
ncbi:MAG: PKD domain-containing protein [Crocinitomicaceae bacterium]|nr:PKD domain-containing protein [Crocinitomicaceae bacterium]